MHSENHLKKLKKVRIMADYQFGKGIGKILFPENVKFILSKTKRIRQILCDEKRIATVRAKDGMLTLSIDGANTIHKATQSPHMRVVILDDAVPFVAKGKTVFSKHVIDIDMNLRALEEVMITDKSGKLCATGQLLLAPMEIIELEQGVAVDVRCGIDS